MAPNASSTLRSSTLRKLAFRLRSLKIDQAPLPAGRLAPIVPAALVVNETPPEARTRNWLAAAAVSTAPVLSAQTNAPSCVACAFRPAAKLYWPLAELLNPPGMVAAMPLAVLDLPPPT